MANDVIIELKNPPDGAELWCLTLTDWNMTVLINELRAGLINITEVSTFEIPGGLSLPLRVASLQIAKWNEDMTAIIQLYYAQSMYPTLWDWDLNDYGDEPDPNYREIFIPELGNYYFDVSIEEFVLTGVAPPIQDWITPLISIATVVAVAVILPKVFKKED